MMPVLDQVATMAVPLDVGALVLEVGGAVGVVLLAVNGWFVRRLITQQDAANTAVVASIKTLDDKVSAQGRETQAIRQELVGLDGRNGIKGTQRAQGRALRRLSQLTNQLAFHAGIDVPSAADEADEDARDAEEAA